MRPEASVFAFGKLQKVPAETVGITGQCDETICQRWSSVANWAARRTSHAPWPLP